MKCGDEGILLERRPDLYHPVDGEGGVPSFPVLWGRGLSVCGEVPRST